MGKVFIEKLLRVTEVKSIILLIRHKKGIEPKDRLISLVNDAVSILLKRESRTYWTLFNSFKAFDGLKKTYSVAQILNRLDVVTGDCEKIDLAMSDDDRKKLSTMSP